MRLAALSSEDMTPEQVDLYRRILSGPRGQGPRAVPLSNGAGGLAGPFNAMLYAPAVGQALQELGVAIRFRTQLSPRVREMAILVVAQAWDSEYERSSHEPIGREAGLTDPEIEALRAGADPGFADEKERVAYSAARSLVGVPADLDDEQYALVSAVLGEQALVELSTLVGYYATLALQLRIFRVGRLTARCRPNKCRPNKCHASIRQLRYLGVGAGTGAVNPPSGSPPIYQTRSDQSSTDIRPGPFRSAKVSPWPNLVRLMLICRNRHTGSSRASSPGGSRPGSGRSARCPRSRPCSRITAWAGTPCCIRCACFARPA
jgi:4-carboxymuconolactone decarboxylase